jgi:hypothetical protein
MSIPVALPELSVALEAYPWGYLVTVRDDLRAQSLAVPTQWRDGALHMSAGAGTRANAVARPDVTMVFPSPTPGEYSLIVDGTATVLDDGLVVTPTWAVLHRPALG